MLAQTTSKVCNVCFLPLPLLAFSKDRAYKDQLNPHCKGCDKIKQDLIRYQGGISLARVRGKKPTPEQVMARLAKQRHGSRQKLYDRLVCPEHFLLRTERREGDRMRWRCRACRRDLKRGPAEKAWRRSPAGRASKRLGRIVRRHRERGGGPLRAADVRRLFATYKTCLCCYSAENLVLEHIRPLARGGTNAFENLQVLCNVCNSRKGTHIIDYRPEVARAS